MDIMEETFKEEEREELLEQLEGEKFFSAKYGRVIEIKEGIISDRFTTIDDNLSYEELELLAEELNASEESDENLEDRTYFDQDA